MSNTARNLGKGLLLVGLVTSLSACETTGQKQNFGAILGAAGGGLLGSTIGSGSGRLAATAAGAALGGLFGSETGKSLDRADAAYARQYQGNTSQVPLAPPAGYPAYTAPPAYSSAIPSAPVRPVSPQASDVQPFGRSSSAPTSCKPLVGEPGSRIAYACQAADGNWFIAR